MPSESRTSRRARAILVNPFADNGERWSSFAAAVGLANHLLSGGGGSGIAGVDNGERTIAPDLGIPPCEIGKTYRMIDLLIGTRPAAAEGDHCKTETAGVDGTDPRGRGIKTAGRRRTAGTACGARKRRGNAA